ncbi:hypothetical protein J437_LFUL016528 [Ladona fulva]|uniref:Peptidase S1 domain-containing protein n=1 Tax=Ladona fulva TaxID=123851 RepID=A0A8K0KLU1_LADFU|nr:hypothetical protein J437_LFUL016528 [Ladona fulva]
MHFLHKNVYAFIRGPAQWVLLGTVDLENSVHGQTHPVIGRYRHPEYSDNAKYNDLALLEIGPALENHSQPTVSKEIHPICLPDWDEESDKGEAVATGWGRVCFGGETSSVLMKVTLDVLNRSKCEETFSREIKYGTSLNKGIDSTMVCAGKLCGGKDTCQGDSGGPLHVPLVRNCMHKLLGVTSFGNFCGCKNSPGVYMRVSSYLSWIESIVWK